MSTRTTLWMLLIALALGGFIWFHESRIAPEREGEEARETRVFPDLGAEQISELEILTSDGKRARLLRTGAASVAGSGSGAGSASSEAGAAEAGAGSDADEAGAAGFAESEDDRAGAGQAEAGRANAGARAFAETDVEMEGSAEAEAGAGGVSGMESGAGGMESGAGVGRAGGVESGAGGVGGAEGMEGASEWMLTEPLLYPADSLTVDGVLDALAGLSFDRAYDVQEGALAQYGLAGPPDIHFESRQGSHALRIGEEAPVGGGMYVTDGKAERVFVIPAYSVNALKKSLNELRDARVLDFDAESITGLNLAWPGERLELQREPGAPWRIASPAPGPASQEVVNDLLRDLQYLRADDFIDEPAADRKLGLDKPKFFAELSAPGASRPLRFEVGLTQTITERIPPDEEDDGGSEGGEAGAESEEFEEVEKEVLVVRGRNGQIFFIPAGHLEDFPRDLADYQPAAPAPVDDADDEAAGPDTTGETPPE